jgi:hypothetical protein
LQIGIVWLLPLQFVFLLFLLTLLLLWLEIPRLCWIRVERVHTLVSFLTLEGMFSVFPHLVWSDEIGHVQVGMAVRLPLSMMLAMGLSYIAFIILRYSPSIPIFIRTFIMRECWILLKAFSTSIEMVKWVLSLLLSMCCTTTNDLHVLNHPYIPGMKPTGSWFMIFFLCCWIQFASILLRISASMFIKEIGL